MKIYLLLFNVCLATFVEIVKGNTVFIPEPSRKDKPSTFKTLLSCKVSPVCTWNLSGVAGNQLYQHGFSFLVDNASWNTFTMNLYSGSKLKFQSTISNMPKIFFLKGITSIQIPNNNLQPFDVRMTVETVFTGCGAALPRVSGEINHSYSEATKLKPLHCSWILLPSNNVKVMILIKSTGWNFRNNWNDDDTLCVYTYNNTFEKKFCASELSLDRPYPLQNLSLPVVVSFSTKSDSVGTHFELFYLHTYQECGYISPLSGVNGSVTLKPLARAKPFYCAWYFYDVNQMPFSSTIAFTVVNTVNKCSNFVEITSNSHQTICTTQTLQLHNISNLMVAYTHRFGMQLFNAQLSFGFEKVDPVTTSTIQSLITQSSISTSPAITSNVLSYLSTTPTLIITSSTPFLLPTTSATLATTSTPPLPTSTTKATTFTTLTIISTTLAATSTSLATTSITPTTTTPTIPGNTTIILKPGRKDRPSTFKTLLSCRALPLCIWNLDWVGMDHRYRHGFSFSADDTSVNSLTVKLFAGSKLKFESTISNVPKIIFLNDITSIQIPNHNLRTFDVRMAVETIFLGCGATLPDLSGEIKYSTQSPFPPRELNCSWLLSPDSMNTANLTSMVLIKSIGKSFRGNTFADSLCVYAYHTTFEKQFCTINVTSDTPIPLQSLSLPVVVSFTTRLNIGSEFDLLYFNTFKECGYIQPVSANGIYHLFSPTDKPSKTRPLHCTWYFYSDGQQLPFSSTIEVSVVNTVSKCDNFVEVTSDISHKRTICETNTLHFNNTNYLKVAYTYNSGMMVFAARLSIKFEKVAPTTPEVPTAISTAPVATSSMQAPTSTTQAATSIAPTPTSTSVSVSSTIAVIAPTPDGQKKGNVLMYVVVGACAGVFCCFLILLCYLCRIRDNKKKKEHPVLEIKPSSNTPKSTTLTKSSTSSIPLVEGSGIETLGHKRSFTNRFKSTFRSSAKASKFGWVAKKDMVSGKELQGTDNLGHTNDYEDGSIELYESSMTGASKVNGSESYVNMNIFGKERNSPTQNSNKPTIVFQDVQNAVIYNVPTNITESAPSTSSPSNKNNNLYDVPKKKKESVDESTQKERSSSNILYAPVLKNEKESVEESPERERSSSNILYAPVSFVADEQRKSVSCDNVLYGSASNGDRKSMFSPQNLFKNFRISRHMGDHNSGESSGVEENSYSSLTKATMKESVGNEHEGNEYAYMISNVKSDTQSSDNALYSTTGSLLKNDNPLYE